MLVFSEHHHCGETDRGDLGKDNLDIKLSSCLPVSPQPRKQVSQSVSLPDGMVLRLIDHIISSKP